MKSSGLRRRDAESQVGYRPQCRRLARFVRPVDQVKIGRRVLASHAKSIILSVNGPKACSSSRASFMRRPPLPPGARAPSLPHP